MIKDDLLQIKYIANVADDHIYTIPSETTLGLMLNYQYSMLVTLAPKASQHSVSLITAFILQKSKPGSLF